MADKSGQFSKEEHNAMRDRAKELKIEAKMIKTREAGEKLVKDAIAKMPEPDKGLATKIHEIVSKAAPDLTPKTWYGFPAYANAEGKVVVFFQYASKFGTRYSTLGFNDVAKLDDGDFWPTSFAVKKIDLAVEKRIVELVKKVIH